MQVIEDLAKDAWNMETVGKYKEKVEQEVPASNPRPWEEDECK